MTQADFLGADQLIKDLNLRGKEQVGVTVSGGKDSLDTWMWLVDNLGPEKVVAFNHQKAGLVHPTAAENPLYDHDDNLQVIMLEDEHCHKVQLTGGGSFSLYPGVRYFDFDQYFPNIPDETELKVKERLGWQRPARSWHFDCLIEQFKDLFYYGLLGYTETDYYLSAMIRHGLISREEAVARLMEMRTEVINSQGAIFELMGQLGVDHLIPQVTEFYESSPFLL